MMIEGPKDYTHLKGLYCPHAMLELQQHIAYVRNFVVHVILERGEALVVATAQVVAMEGASLLIFLMPRHMLAFSAQFLLSDDIQTASQRTQI